MKIVIIDNYDSFTYNLAHLVKELGADVTVYRNDQFQLRELDRFDKIILSPGPGIPSEAGLLMDVIKTYAGRKPMLGVCLGHQAIGEAFGAKLTNLSEVYHGVATPCTQFGNDPIYAGMEKRIEIGRYHSWVVDRSGFPDCLDVTAVIDTFPAGTLSGAPKVRAMQIISELEPHNRGAYGGCIGFIGLNGDLNQAIVIRTFISRNGELWFQAGCGVVAKSNDQYELEECNNKLGALTKAIHIAEEL